MANSVLAKLAVEIAANTASFNKSLNQSQANFSKFTSGILKAGAALGLAFTGKEIAQAGFEMAKLAGEAEGVKAAFDRLPESAKLMNDLKDATSGTVSELDLMKRTVQAANFGISLQALPDLLKFAAIRAQQTGQSVDYLVDSIITGIGRKSPLILDNLGISAVRLKEQFNGASLEAQNIGDVAQAVGRIASEELKKMGDFSDNTSSKVQRLSASWENFKVAIGGVINESGILQSVLDSITDTLTVDSNEQRAALEAVLDQLNSGSIDAENYANALKFAQTQAKNLGVNLVVLTDQLTGIRKVMIDPRSKIQVVEPQEAQKQIVTLETLQEKLKELNDQFANTDENDKKKLVNLGNEIIKTQALIEELEKYRKKQKEVNDLRKVSIEAPAGLLKTAQEFNRVQEEAKKANEDIGKFVTTIVTVPTLPDKVDVPQWMKDYVSTLDTFGEEVQQKVADLSGMVANSITGLADAIGEAFASGEFENFGRALLESVASFAQQLGSLMIAMGIGEIALKGAPGPVKVAAGIGLVAAGAAVKKLLSKQKSFPNAGTGGRSGGFESTSTNNVGSVQDSKVQVEVTGVLRGQDIWLSGNNFQKNNQFLKPNG